MKKGAWLGALVLAYSSVFASLTEDLIQPFHKRLPVVIVYFDNESLYDYNNNFKIYRPEKFKTAWSSRMRELNSTWQNFLLTYDKIPLEIHRGAISLYFFSNDGVYLWHKKIPPENSSQNVPDWETLETVETWEKEYEHYKKTNQTKRSLLFWPLRAYESNRYRLARVWLSKVQTSRLTKDERKGYERLEYLLAHVQSPE